jgi:methionine-rich copper-binding protein CopC
VLAAAVILTTALPASAHDQLIESSPGDGERLDAAPESISMTFSGELLVLDASNTGAVVLVVDGTGEDWATGDVVVTGRTVTAALRPGMPSAGYQVRWQVVSEDGHPIAGVIPFTVGDAAPMTMTDSGGASADGADTDGTTRADTAQSDQIADDTGGVVRTLLIGGGGAAAAAIVFVAILHFRRPRTAAAAPEAGPTAVDDL